MRTYKFATLTDDGFTTGITSRGVKTVWVAGITHRVAPPTEFCVGLNSCELIQNARKYVQGDVLLVIDDGGVVITGGNKRTAEVQTCMAVYDASDYEARRTPLDDDYQAKLKPLYDDYRAKRKPLDDDYRAKLKPLYDDYEAALHATFCTPDRLLDGLYEEEEK